MTTDLTTTTTSQQIAPITEESWDKEMGEAKAMNHFLGRLQLVGLNSDLAMPPNNLKAGDFYLVSSEDGVPAVQIGSEANITIIEKRFKAFTYTRGDSKETTVSYDPNDQLYQDIKAKAANRQQDQAGPQYMWGPEFLVFIHEIGQFATFYCCNLSAQNVANGSIRPMLNSGINYIMIQQHLAENKAKQKWWTFKAYRATTAPIIELNEAAAEYERSQFLTAQVKLPEEESR